MAEAFEYKNIKAADPTTTIVKVGQGILHTITINSPLAGGLVSIWDGIQGTEDIEGEIIGEILTPAVYLPDTLTYDIAFKKGLLIRTSIVAQDITVSYS